MKGKENLKISGIK